MILKGWRTVFEISSSRHQTKRGADHLSDHGIEVLEKAFEAEGATLMRSILASTLGR